MKCDICGKNTATVHLTEIVDDQMSEMHLCEECAREKSVQMEQQFGLADLLAGLTDIGKQVKDVDKAVVRCDNCGLSYEEFRKLGRLGCGQCYTSFHSQLGILLKKIHGSSTHYGKQPIKLKAAKGKKSKATAEKASDLTNASPQVLKKQLQEAIEDEDFEKAATLRDKIRSMENKQEP